MPQRRTQRTEVGGHGPLRVKSGSNQQVQNSIADTNAECYVLPGDRSSGSFFHATLAAVLAAVTARIVALGIALGIALGMCLLAGLLLCNLPVCVPRTIVNGQELLLVAKTLARHRIREGVKAVRDTSSVN